MNKELRDYLLDVFLSLSSIQHHIGENPLIAMMCAKDLTYMGAVRLSTAKIYHSLADEKDLELLDEDGWPLEFQRRRLMKISQKSFDEYREKIEKHGGNSYTSLRHGDIIAAKKKEPSKCDDCGHVHD